MQPIRTTELALQFAARLSPWWLLLAIPLVAAIAWLLYANQRRGLARPHALGLSCLRIAVLAAMVFLAFRPSLIWREILTFPARIVLLVDDSASMTARDDRLDGAEAARVARTLWGSIEGAAERATELADQLVAAEIEVRGFQSLSRTADRNRDAFWDRAERAEQALVDLYDGFEDALAGIPAPDADREAILADASLVLASLGTDAPSLFTGDEHPGDEVFDAYCARIEDAEQSLRQLQSAVDKEALSREDPALSAAVERVRSQTRAELVTAALRRFAAQLREQAGQRGVRVVRLGSGDEGPLDSLDPGARAAGGGTDILGRIGALLSEDNPFPLSAIALISDGRDLGEGSLPAVARLATRRQVPVLCAGAGDAVEPTDVAVADVHAAPFAVAGSPTAVRVRLKTSLPSETEARIEILRNGEPTATETRILGSNAYERVVVQLTPEEPGRATYTVRAPSLPAEVFPSQNNEASFVIETREGKVTVLFLDWRPRWETRFALNILQRLDYVDLNAIVVLAQEDFELQRGTRKGAWPEDLASLRMYDLVVLGALPDDLLTAQEWADLRAFVETHGGTLCVLGAAGAPLLPPGAGGALTLLPLPPGDATADRGPTNAEDLSRICLTDVGRLHPLTRELAQALTVSADEDAARLRPADQSLLLRTPGGEAVLSTRFAGKGKVAALDTDRLWKRLNPTLLNAHAAVFISLVAWSVEGGIAAGDAAGPRAIYLDQGTATTRQGVQAWVNGAAADDVVEAMVEGETVAEAALAPARPGTDLLRASFAPLPVGRVQFRVRANGPETVDPLVVLDDDPELNVLSRDDRFMGALAEATGGEYRRLVDLPRLLVNAPQRERVQKSERTWRLWDSRIVLLLLAVGLSIEWIWRKLVGLV